MKRIFGKLLLGLVISGTLASGAFAKDYADLSSSHWAYDEINELSNQNVLVGYPDSTFKPDSSATRAEFANMVIKALYQEHTVPTAIVEFYDLPYSHWAFKTIQRAVSFDLIKGSEDGKFRPEESISRAEAIAIMVSAINTDNVTDVKAVNALNVYKDAKSIPAKYKVNAGKAQLLGLTATSSAGTSFNADKNITRAEIAVSLHKMRELAKKNPNNKLRDVLKHKKAEGTQVPGVIVEGDFATIPAGSVIPVRLLKEFTTKTSFDGEVLLTILANNIVTENNELLIPKNSNIVCKVANVKKGIPFWRNAKLNVESSSIRTPLPQNAIFLGNVKAKSMSDINFFHRMYRYVVRGFNVELEEQDTVFVEVKEPIKVNLINTHIVK